MIVSYEIGHMHHFLDPNLKQIFQSLLDLLQALEK